MSWESIGSTSSGQMPDDEGWILMSLRLARTFIIFVCGEPPANSKLDVMWHEHDLGSYPSLGVWSEYEHPWDYISSCERALESFDGAVSWTRLENYMEEQVSQVDDGDDDPAEIEQPKIEAIELLATFKASAARFAHEMLKNASYMQRELPSIELETSCRAQLVELCSSLVGAKHDLISELHDLGEVDATDPTETLRRVRRVVDWAAEELQRLHATVNSLEPSAATHPGQGIAYLLVAESGTNVLKAFVEMSDAADDFIGRAEGSD